MENQAQQSAPQQTPPTGPATQPSDPNQTLKIVGLIVNIAVLPGLGTIIAKQMKPGVIQLVLALVGWVLIWTIIGMIIGIPLMMIAWVWALITSIKWFTAK